MKQPSKDNHLTSSKESNSSTIKGVLISNLLTFNDHRGFFREVLRAEKDDLSKTVSQISHSEVYPGVIKAWHGHAYQYQWTYVVKGALQVALADMRSDSDSYQQIHTFTCGGCNQPIIYGFPPGVYHGYRNLGNTAQVIYLTSGHYDPDEEMRIDPYSNKINYSWEPIYN